MLHSIIRETILIITRLSKNIYDILNNIFYCTWNINKLQPVPEPSKFVNNIWRVGGRPALTYSLSNGDSKNMLFNQTQIKVFIEIVSTKEKLTFSKRISADHCCSFQSFDACFRFLRSTQQGLLPKIFWLYRKLN